MWVRFLLGAQNDTSRFESAEEPRAAGAREENLFGKLPVFLTVATKWLGAGTEKWAVLSRTVWFVPTFVTKVAISEILSDEDKKRLVLYPESIPAGVRLYLPLREPISRRTTDSVASTAPPSARSKPFPYIFSAAPTRISPPLGEMMVSISV